MDKDGFVDGIRSQDKFSNKMDYVAKGYEPKYGKRFSKSYTKEMTPEMIETASKILQGTQDLRFRIVKQDYEAKQRKSQPITKTFPTVR